MRFGVWVAAMVASAVMGTLPAHAATPAVDDAPKKRVMRKPPTRPAATRPSAPVADTPAATASTAAASAATIPAVESAEQLRRQRAEIEALRGTTVELIRLMVREGVLTRSKAEQLLGDSLRGGLPDEAPVKPDVAPTSREPAPADGTTSSVAASTSESAPEPSGSTPRRQRAQTVRVPYVPEVVKTEIRDQIKQEVLAQAKAERWAEPGTLPEWLDRIVWEGDMRLRYQGEYFAPDNMAPADFESLTGRAIDNTRTDRDLWRMRVRLGMLAKLGESLGAGFRIATGTTDNPVSTNASLGRANSPQSIVLDRAYLKWDPSDRWSVSGGRMPNPWFWPTDLVWDEDLNFDGIAATFKPALTPSSGVFVTAGIFPLQSSDPKPRTPDPQAKWLYGLQVGGEWRPETGSRVTLAAGLYDFRNVEGRPNPVGLQTNDWTAAQALQKGNSLFDLNASTGGAALYGLASKFRVLNVGAEAEFGRFDPFFIKLSTDFAKNLGFDATEIRTRTRLPLSEGTSAYQARVTFGRDAIRARHDWQAFVGYRHVERDAVMDAFTDSDFNLGGTNTKGYFVGGFYGLDRNVFLRLRYLSGRPIETFGNQLRLGIDVFQTDLNVRF